MHMSVHWECWWIPHTRLAFKYNNLTNPYLNVVSLHLYYRPALPAVTPQTSCLGSAPPLILTLPSPSHRGLCNGVPHPTPASWRPWRRRRRTSATTWTPPRPWTPTRTRSITGSPRLSDPTLIYFNLQNTFTFRFLLPRRLAQSPTPPLHPTIPVKPSDRPSTPGWPLVDPWLTPGWPAVPSVAFPLVWSSSEHRSPAPS